MGCTGSAIVRSQTTEGVTEAVPQLRWGGSLEAVRFRFRPLRFMRVGDFANGGPELLAASSSEPSAIAGRRRDL
jgi:hypothetical protein